MQTWQRTLYLAFSVSVCLGSLLSTLSLVGCGGSGGSGGGSNSPPPPAIAVSITEGAASVLLGNTVQFAATVSGTSNTGVTWTVAGPGTLSSTGFYTAPATLPTPPTVTVTATSQADATHAASTTLAIRSDVGVTLQTTPAGVTSLPPQGTVTLTAAITSHGKPDPSVTWTVNGIRNGNASVGTITSAGASVRYTAPAAAPSPAQVTITATSVADPAQAASLPVSIGTNAAPPAATMTFPGETALLTSGHVTVRGTAQSPVAIARVEVNGVAATSADGFATWAATLELPPGTSPLIVSTADVLGHRDETAAMALVTVMPFFEAPRGIAVEATGQLVVADTQRVMRVDPRSGARTVVSDATTGSGPPFIALTGIAVEATGQLVVVDAQRVMRVDPRSGVRTVVSDASTGSGPPFIALMGIAVETTGQLVVADSGVFPQLPDTDTQRVMRVDPRSGTRTVVSDATTGSGPLLGALAGIAVEATGQLVVVDTRRVMRVDPRSGTRTVVSNASTGGVFDFFTGIAVEATGQLVVMHEANFEPVDGFTSVEVIRVDPTSGARTFVSSVPSSEFIQGVLPTLGIAVEATGQLVVVEAGSFGVHGRVVRVDPRSGALTIVSDESTGNGPPFAALQRIAIEATGQFIVNDVKGIFASGPTTGRMVRVDPRSGARTIVSDNGPLFRSPFFDTALKGIAVEATGQLVVVDPQSQVVRVDPRSGAGTVVSGATTGSGPPFGALRDIAVEATGQLVVADTQRVMRVDPGSGARTVVSDATTGSGPPFGALRGIAVEATGQLVVLEEARVVRVDPGSGARTVVSDATTGSGSPFGALRGIAVEATGQLVVLEGARVVRVDPGSGARTVVSDATTGSGPPFGALGGIAVEATGQLVVGDAVLGAVLRVEARSGDRAIISR